jgi:D-sedoheptulose 7-phosphate isomerase
MLKEIEAYQRTFMELLNSVQVTTEDGRNMDYGDGVAAVCNLIRQQSAAGWKLIFIGNGGSAAIASHMALDFWKNGGMKAISFNDGVTLTCLGNDYGYAHVFEKPVEMFAEPGDVLIAISSSGKSENILLGVAAAMAKGCRVVTLSGFGADNPLRTRGKYNFYVASGKYGPVEVIHQYLIHCILDLLMATSRS